MARTVGIGIQDFGDMIRRRKLRTIKNSLETEMPGRDFRRKAAEHLFPRKGHRSAETGTNCHKWQLNGEKNGKKKI